MSLSRRQLLLGRMFRTAPSEDQEVVRQEVDSILQRARRPAPARRPAESPHPAFLRDPRELP